MNTDLVSDSEHRSFADFDSVFSGEIMFYNEGDQVGKDDIRVPSDLIIKLADMILYDLFMQLPQSLRDNLCYANAKRWNHDSDACRPIRGKNMVRIDDAEIWFFHDLSCTAKIRRGSKEKIIQAEVLRKLVRRCLRSLFRDDFFEELPECPWRKSINALIQE